MSTQPQRLKAEGLLDLDRYPLTSASFMAECRDVVRRDGCCYLPGFLHARGIELLRSEADDVKARVHHSDRRFTPWYKQPDASLPATDPRSQTVRFAVGYVARDCLGARSVAERVFCFEALLEFIRSILGASRLYRFDDALGSLNYTLMSAGEELGWHFDACEAVASIALTSADGGRFDYIGPLHGTQQQVRARVSAALAGDETAMHSIDMQSGDFLLFQGRHSLHRVTPVQGAKPRVMLLMSYDDVAARPEANSSNGTLFGRAGG